MFRRNQTFPIYRQNGHVKTFLPGKILKRVQHRVMLDGRSDKVTAFWFQQPGGAKNRKVRALGTAAGENNFTRFTAENFGSSLAKIIQTSPCFAANVMHRRGISPNVA